MLDTGIARAVERALRGLAYGTIQLTIHDGRLVQVERVERVRLTGQAGSRPGPCGRPTACTEDGASERIVE